MTYEKTEKNDRLKAEAKDLCPACEQVIWISFYFDGFGFDKENSSAPMSNIGVLANTALDIKDKGIRSFYYPGLGAPFDPEAAALALVLKDQVKDKAKGKVGEVKGAAKKTVKEAAIKTWSESQGTTVERLKNLGSGTVTEVKKVAGEAYQKKLKEAKINLRKAVSPKFYLRKSKQLTRHWVGVFEKIARSPTRVFKMLRWETMKAVFDNTIEDIGFLRDTKLVSTLFNTGVKVRLATAETDFTKAVSGATFKIKHINVAVFGYDSGAAMAVAFSNHLLKEVCKDGVYNGKTVNIRFVGLFDCVANRYDNNFLTGFIPLANEVTGDLLLHPKVECAVHYAAANEYRFYKPLSTFNGKREPGSKREERLFPGSQEDVGGGYIDGEDGQSNHISHIVLKMMHGRAWRNGVPVMSLDEIGADAKMMAHFVVAPELDTLIYRYWSKVKALSTKVTQVKAELKSFSQGYIDTGNACTMVLPHNYTELPANIKEELPGHQALYIAWLKHWYLNFNREDRKGSAWRRFVKFQEEIESLEKRAKLPPMEPGALNQSDKELWALWSSTGSASLLEDLTPLFEKYMHDSMAECLLEDVWGTFIYSRHYFNYRVMNDIKTKIEKDWIEKAEDFIKKREAKHQKMVMEGYAKNEVACEVYKAPEAAVKGVKDVGTCTPLSPEQSKALRAAWKG